MYAGVDSWIVDSGVGDHAVPQDDTKNVIKLYPVLHLEKTMTANGNVQNTHRAKVYVESLGITVDAKVQGGDCPRLLSNGKLAREHGFTIITSPDNDGNTTITNDYEVHHCVEAQGVPTIGL